MLVSIGQRTEIHLECSCQFEQILTDVQQNVLTDRILKYYVPEYMKVYVSNTNSELFMEATTYSQEVADKISRFFEQIAEQFEKEITQ